MLPINGFPKREFFARNQGLTIIEVLIVVSAFVFISLAAFSFLSMTILSSSKASAVKEVRQNGSYALLTIEKLVVSAKSVSCLSPQSLEVTDLNDLVTTISCSGERIASGSSFLTSSRVKVSNCNFTCTVTTGIPRAIDARFDVNIGTAGSRASEKSSLTFQNKFVVKNQID